MKNKILVKSWISVVAGSLSESPLQYRKHVNLDVTTSKLRSGVAYRCIFVANR
jgi:hypothetical protein